MKHWYLITYESPRERGSMLCKGSHPSEAKLEAYDRMDADAEIVSCIQQETVFPRQYHNRTIDGKPRKAYK